jgi:hypothetical protein
MSQADLSTQQPLTSTPIHSSKDKPSSVSSAFSEITNISEAPPCFESVFEKECSSAGSSTFLESFPSDSEQGDVHLYEQSPSCTPDLPCVICKMPMLSPYRECASSYEVFLLCMPEEEEEEGEEEDLCPVCHQAMAIHYRECFSWDASQLSMPLVDQTCQLQSQLEMAEDST